MQIELMPAHELNPAAYNPRVSLKPGDPEWEALRGSLLKFGFAEPVVYNRRTGHLVGGHQRLEVAKSLGWVEIPASVVDLSEMDEKALNLALNRIDGRWDQDALTELLRDLRAGEVDLELTGFNPREISSLLEEASQSSSSGGGGGAKRGPRKAKPAPALASLLETMAIQPLSILDSQEPYWVERRQAWEELRVSGVLFPGGLTGRVYGEKGYGFDPVLAELVYRWFSAEGQLILDPFAGGSTRGMVAGALGRSYLGIELQAQQVQANQDQLKSVADWPALPEWETGDALRILPKLIEHGQKADMLFMCPPCFDAEKYSDNPSDLSRMSRAKFLEAYREIIRLSLELLPADALAVVLVREVRDQKTGFARNMIFNTHANFMGCGAELYNEFSYLGGLDGIPANAEQRWIGSRKTVSVHENLLVFCKGSWKKAVERLQELQPGVDFAELEPEEE